METRTKILIARFIKNTPEYRETDSRFFPEPCAIVNGTVATVKTVEMTGANLARPQSDHG
jgi:hypothetical protein